jgi:hypothetical protein
MDMINDCRAVRNGTPGPFQKNYNRFVFDKLHLNRMCPSAGTLSDKSPHGTSRWFDLDTRPAITGVGLSLDKYEPDMSTCPVDPWFDADVHSAPHSRVKPIWH